MALMGLVYRDQLFPRQAFRMTVDLLALAHDRGCEAELAEHLEEDLSQHRTPDIPTLRALFGPSEDALPVVKVQMADLASYNRLVSNAASTLEVTA